MIPMGKVYDKGSIPRDEDYSSRGGIIQFDSSRINASAKEKDAWMAGYFMWGYADDMVRIKSIDTVKKTISTASANSLWIWNRRIVEKMVWSKHPFGVGYGG